jgi:hypothetical protein
MTMAWQVAQKLHAVTAVLPDGRPNHRAHDMVDLQILKASLVDDPLHPVRQACIDAFASRGQHAWPPTVTVHDLGPRLYNAALASVSSMGFVGDVQRAAEMVTDFIARVDDAIAGS